MRAVWASKRRRASSQVRSRISVAFRVEETAAIESTSDSRNVVCAWSSSSANSWRRRSVTIRYSAKAPKNAVEATRPPAATAGSPKASPSAPTSAAPTVQPTRMPRALREKRPSTVNRRW
jgi:hypothetical protein